MSKQELERLSDLGIGAWDDHKADAFADQFADSFVLRDTTVQGELHTRDEVIAYCENWFTAFPDLRVHQTNRVVGDDSVAGELEFTGTNTGPMKMGGMELPPTGKKVVGRGAYLARVQDGKVVDFSSHPDAAGMMVQLGLIPGA